MLALKIQSLGLLITLKTATNERSSCYITALLPLFYEKADTPAMIKHGMDVLREATSFLNPGQVSSHHSGSTFVCVGKSHSVEVAS